MTWAVTGIQNRLDRLQVSGQWGLVRLQVCSDMGGDRHTVQNRLDRLQVSGQWGLVRLQVCRDMGGDRHTEQTGQTTGKWSVGSGEVTGVQ